MQNTIQLIKDFFDSNKWKYDFNEERNVFSSNINMNSIIGVLRIYIFVRDHDYRVYAILNNNAEKNVYPSVAEYLHRVNYGLYNGNFEFDYRDGEVRYKTFVNFENITLSSSVIEDSIFIPVFMFERYGKNLLRVMLGENNIEQLISEVES